MPKVKSFSPSQIDYILVSARWSSSVKDCKVKWGISLKRFGRRAAYDHGLVRCLMKTQLCARKAKPAADYSVLESNVDTRI